MWPKLAAQREGVDTGALLPRRSGGLEAPRRPTTELAQAIAMRHTTQASYYCTPCSRSIGSPKLKLLVLLVHDIMRFSELSTRKCG